MTDIDYIPASRKEACAIGAKVYLSGTACIHGHIATRYAKDGSCTECKRIATIERADRALTDPALLEKMRGWHRESKRRARSTEEGKAQQFAANRRYIEKNRDKVNTYYRERAKTSPTTKMARAARSMVHRVLGRLNLRKDATCVELLGYTGHDLKAHIERQFTKGMSWERFGIDIHIDHIIPVAEWIRRGETDPSVINALSNLRPMWAKANAAKRDLVGTLL
jgi:hypothetical protein